MNYNYNTDEGAKLAVSNARGVTSFNKDGLYYIRRTIGTNGDRRYTYYTIDPRVPGIPMPISQSSWEEQRKNYMDGLRKEVILRGESFLRESRLSVKKLLNLDQENLEDLLAIA